MDGERGLSRPYSSRVMVGVDYLWLVVSNRDKYEISKRPAVSRDYKNTRDLAEAVYRHTRFRLPYRLIVIGHRQ